MTTTGLRPRLNVRQRKDTGYLPHSSPPSRFNFDQPSSILMGIYHWSRKTKNETDKIHTPRIVPQKTGAHAI